MGSHGVKVQYGNEFVPSGFSGYDLYARLGDLQYLRHKLDQCYIGLALNRRGFQADLYSAVVEDLDNLILAGTSGDADRQGGAPLTIMLVKVSRFHD